MTAVEIKEQCLRLLAQREHSQQELVQKLSLRGFAAVLVKPVLAELVTEGWQSDQRYAQSYARQRLDKGYGWQRIAYELRQRGISDADLQTLKCEFAEVDEQQSVFQLYEKKFGLEPVNSRQEWAKRTRFLLQRGFSNSMISALGKQLQAKHS